MKKPIVAVLICVYEGDNLDYFKKALESITSQTYPSPYVRIYLGVDGFVNKNFQEFIDQAKNFYKVIINDTNIGLTKTLNKLIDSLEDEEFVFRMDADDISMTNRFEKQVTFMQKHPEVDILGTGIYEIDDVGRRLRFRRYPSHNEEIKKFIVKAVPLQHSTICFRKQFLMRFKYPEKYRMNQDLALFFLALKNGCILANLPEPLHQWRFSTSYFLRRGRKRALTEFLIYISGIYSLYGISYKIIYPLSRIVFRLLPVQLLSLIYKSSLKRRFLKG